MNPTIFLGGRGAGKTTQLINWCKANNGILLCYSQSIANAYKRIYGIKAECYSSVSHSLNKEHKPIAIDNCTKFLQWVADTRELAISLDTDNAFLCELKGPKNIDYPEPFGEDEC